MDLKLSIVGAERTRGAVSNPITKWHFKISTGSRCRGLLSAYKYTCPIKAAEAGERMIKKLKQPNDNGRE